MTIDQKTIQAIIIKMQKLEDSVKKCAPHPDNPGHRGFIYAKSDQRTSGSRDSVFGALVADHILGVGLGAFSEGIIGELDAGHFIDAADEFWVERQQSKENKAQAVRLSFHAACLGSEYQAREMAFDADLPKRVQLERMYMRLSRKLDQAEFDYDTSPEHKLENELKCVEYDYAA